MTRWRTLVVRASKFGLVGAVCFVVDSGVFNLLRVMWDDKPLTISIIATLVSTVVNYLGNRHFSFADAGDRHSRRREMVLFVAVSTAAILASQLPLAISRYGLGLDDPLSDNIARVLFGTAVGMIVRFWGYHQFVFPSTRHAGASGGAAGTRTPGTTAAVPAPAAAPATAPVSAAVPVSAGSPAAPAMAAPAAPPSAADGARATSDERPARRQDGPTGELPLIGAGRR